MRNNALPAPVRVLRNYFHRNTGYSTGGQRTPTLAEKQMVTYFTSSQNHNNMILPSTPTLVYQGRSRIGNDVSSFVWWASDAAEYI